MLKESEFKWLVRKINNIEENPVECHYCVIDCGDGTGKIYIVWPMQEQNTEGRISSGTAKYFAFLECDVQLAGEKERAYPYSMALYSGYCVMSETLIAVFDTLEDVKKRAYTQYAHHYGYVMPHIVDDIKGNLQKHFVVGGA